VFTRHRIAVFIDGCYWHGCSEHHRPARTNGTFWSEKIAANRRRDEDTNRSLAEAGWTVLCFWEHEDPALVASAILTTVKRRVRNTR